MKRRVSPAYVLVGVNLLEQDLEFKLYTKDM